MLKEYADEYKCPVCGITFICPHKNLWAYQKTFYAKEYVFCSWGCLQKKRREIEEEQAKKPNRRGRRRRT